MTLTRRSLLKSTALLPLASLTSCSSSGLIFALDVAEVAATASVPVITAFSAQLGPLAPVAIAYAKGIANACVLSVAELGSSDPTATKDKNILDYFAAVAELALPAGTVSEVVSAIDATVAAVELIINQIRGTVAAKKPVSARASAQATTSANLLAQYQAQVQALGSDKKRIADILVRAHSIQ